jgi:hypothetical protein
MTFGLKNAGATYQRAMNLIFHDLLGIIVEVYIDDIVVKSAGDDSHLADLRLAFEKMRRYKLKMNPPKCGFGVSAGKFLGFIVHEKDIEIDPKKIEAIQSVKAPTCKKDLQKFLGKVNYLRRFMLVEIGPEGGRRHNSPLIIPLPFEGRQPEAPSEAGGETMVLLLPSLPLPILHFAYF